MKNVLTVILMEGMSFDVKCVTSCDVSGTLMIKKYLGTSLRVQWLGFHTSNTAGVGSVPGLGAEIPSVVCREHTHTHTHTHTHKDTYLCVCVVAKSLQSSPSLCNSARCSPPGSSAQGILQARRLEWVATPPSRGSS